MNEATLEGNLNATLDRLFRGPLRPKIEHQRVLTLRFGHHTVTVDGVERSESRGRLDVLLKTEESPLAVLELKRKGLPLTADDETQACSYARLLDPMPPLYIVTNGEETRFFRTYDKQRLDVESIDDRTLANQITAAAGAAAADLTSAIQFLLGHSPEVFRQLFRGATQTELNFLTGPVEELTLPLAKEFRLPRLATAALQQRIIDRHPVIVLVGPPLSGKTNVVAELCERSVNGPPSSQQIIPLYVNCSQLPQGVFQSLATGLTKNTGVPATAEDIRQWLTAGVITTDADRPVIILDAWPPYSNERWERDLAELLELASDVTFSLIVVLDDVQAEAMLVDPIRGRPSRLGSMAVRVRISALLSHQELAVADYYLAQHNDLHLERGAEHNIFYRYPYTWRLLACIPRTNGQVPSVLGTEYIHAARQVVQPSQQHIQLLRQYAQCVALETASGSVGEVLMASPGWSTWEAAVAELGITGIEQLRDAGFVRARSGPKDRTLLSMQIPSLLASVASNLLAERLQAAMKDSTTLNAVNDVQLQCQRFPYGALVGASAILSLEPQMLTSVIDELLSREPEISRLPSDARVGMLVEGSEMFEIPPDILRQSVDDGADQLFGNPLPYLILSYIASWINVDSREGQATFKRIVDRVGSVRMPIFPVDNDFGENRRVALPVSCYRLSGGGSLLECSNGILEPITDAVRRATLNSPDLVRNYTVELLSREAAPLALLYRVWTAVASVSQMATPAASVVKQSADALYERIKERLVAELKQQAHPTSRAGSHSRDTKRNKRNEKKRKKQNRKQKQSQNRRNR